MSDAPVVVTGVAVDHAVVGAAIVEADEAAEPSVRVTSADLHRLTGYSLDALISKAEVDLSSSGAFCAAAAILNSHARFSIAAISILTLSALRLQFSAQFSRRRAPSQASTTRRSTR